MKMECGLNWVLMGYSQAILVFLAIQVAVNPILLLVCIILYLKNTKGKANFQKNAKFFLIDFNGEYVRNTDADPDRVITELEYKNIYKLSTRSQDDGDKFPIPSEVINEPLIWTVLLEATEKTQQPFIKRALENTYINSQFTSADAYKNFIRQIIFDITKNKDKNLEKALVINFLKDLDDCGAGFSGISEAIQHFGHLKYHNTASDYYFNTRGGQIFSTNGGFDALINQGVEYITTPVENINGITKIMLKLVSCYYNDIVRGYANKEHISPLISRLKSRVPDLVKVIEEREPTVAEQKSLTIVSMKSLNIHMRKILPLIFCKHLYEQKKT